jgi:hypothetical protein
MVSTKATILTHTLGVHTVGIGRLRTGEIYVDFYSLLIDKQGGLRSDLSDDGLHPNRNGYKVMAPPLLRAITEAQEAE